MLVQARRRLEKRKGSVIGRYDDDGHGRNVGVRLLLLAAIIDAAKALPPQRADVECKIREARGGNTRRSATCNNTWLHGVLPTDRYVTFCVG